MEPAAPGTECFCDRWRVYDQYGEPKSVDIVYGFCGEGGASCGGGDEEGEFELDLALTLTVISNDSEKSYTSGITANALLLGIVCMHNA